MTQREFVEKYFHEFFGMVADGAVRARQGGELSLWLRQMQSRAYALLGQAWQSLQPPAPTNGKDVSREQRAERK